MTKYRNKPVVIEAMQWPGRDGTSFDDWLTEDEHKIVHIVATGGPWFNDDDIFEWGDLAIQTLEGEMRAHPGDYVIRGVQGELYPCKPDIFEATFEKADR